VVNFADKKVTRKRETVVMAGTQPDPHPRPDPDPAPIGAVRRFVVVEDSSKAGAWRGDVLGSPKVVALYKALGLSHRLIDIHADGDDPAAVAYRRLAAGKALPWIWLLDAGGTVLREQACPTDPDAFVALFDAHPGERALGAILAPPKLTWARFGASPGVPLIPRDRWKPVDLSAFLPPVRDQNGVGQCASSSACTVWEACRAQAGLPYVYASAGDLYSRVNGGRDRGSRPRTTSASCSRTGSRRSRWCRTSGTAGGRRRPRWWRRGGRTGLAEAYLCDDFDAVASAVQQGFVAQVAIWWYDNFTPDAAGVLPRTGPGQPRRARAVRVRAVPAARRNLGAAGAQLVGAGVGEGRQLRHPRGAVPRRQRVRQRVGVPERRADPNRLPGAAAVARARRLAPASLRPRTARTQAVNARRTHLTTGPNPDPFARFAYPSLTEAHRHGSNCIPRLPGGRARRLALAVAAPGLRADEPAAKYVLQADGTVIRQVADLRRELTDTRAELEAAKGRLAELERAAGSPVVRTGEPAAAPPLLMLGGAPHQLRADGRYWPLGARRCLPRSRRASRRRSRPRRVRERPLPGPLKPLPSTRPNPQVIR
jgi:hypothetical protein